MSSPVCILYICLRGNHLKVIGPVIDEQPNVFPNSKAALWISTGRKRHEKPGTSVSIEEFQALAEKRGHVELVIAENLSDAIRQTKAKAVVTVALSLPCSLDEANRVRQDGVKFFSLGYFGEEFVFSVPDGVRMAALEPWEVVTTFSQLWVDSLCDVLANEQDRDIVREKVKPIGFTELDQVKHFNKDEIKKKYGIPLDKKVVYFSTYPNFSRLGWIHKIIRHSNSLVCDCVHFLLKPYFHRWEVDALIAYRKLMKDIREWADNNGWFIVSKTRFKHRDPGFVYKRSHMTLGDGLYYPFRTLELLFASDICISYPTCTVIEALFLRKRSLTLYNLPFFAIHGPLLYDFKEQIYRDCLWQNPDVAAVYWLYERDGYERFLLELEKKKDCNIDETAFHRSVTKLLEHDDLNASARFLNLIADRIDQNKEPRGKST